MLVLKRNTPETNCSTPQEVARDVRAAQTDRSKQWQKVDQSWSSCTYSAQDYLLDSSNKNNNYSTEKQ